MDSISPVEQKVKSIIRDWQRRRNAGARSLAAVKRNAAFITEQVAAGGWATDFVADMCRLENQPVTVAEVQAVAKAMLAEAGR